MVDTGNGNGFTRAGNFQLDRDGNLISSDGFNVQGYMATGGVLDMTADLSNITINMGMNVPANATTNVTVNANLDCRTATDGIFSAPVMVYDSLGTAHTITLQFTKTDAGWSWSALIPGADIGATDATVVGNGDLTFDEAGNITDGTENGTLSITNLVSGASDMDITFNLFDENGNSNITDFAADSSVAKTVQDGFPSSVLTKTSVDSAGVILGTTSSGQSIALAQLALANFPNSGGLQKYQGNTFVTFASSGEPSIGRAGTGGRGIISGSSLEQSNVDMAQEFVNLISAQRAYQANSRIITTSDELYQESLNMKR